MFDDEDENISIKTQHTVKELLNIDFGELIPKKEKTEENFEEVNIEKMLDINLDDKKEFMVYNVFEYHKKYDKNYANVIEYQFTDIWKRDLYEMVSMNVMNDVLYERIKEFSVKGELLTKQEAIKTIEMLKKFKEFMEE